MGKLPEASQEGAGLVETLAAFGAGPVPLGAGALLAAFGPPVGAVPLLPLAGATASEAAALGPTPGGTLAWLGGGTFRPGGRGTLLGCGAVG